VTRVPTLKSTEHAEGQETPPGVLVTTPFVLATWRLNVVACDVAVTFTSGFIVTVQVSDVFGQVPALDGVTVQPTKLFPAEGVAVSTTVAPEA
jgi:hypothetical protein